MSEENFNETMLDVFIFETNKHLESLETQVLQNEKNSCFTKESINEIFRSMHTIKGSAAMMLFDNISTLSHSVEDVFYFLREQTSENMDCSNISDMVLESVDFIRAEVEKIKNGEKSDGDASELIAEIDMFLTLLKQDNGVVEKKEQTVNNPAQQFYIPPEPKQNTVDVNHYEAKIRFDDDCGMENIRAYNLIHKVLEFTDDVHHIPDKILENDESSKIIKENGFTVYINTNQNYAELYETLMQTAFLKSLELHELDSSEISVKQIDLGDVTEPDMTIKIPVLSAKVKVADEARESTSMSGQSMISVSVNKLDKLMDLMGEMAIAEAMVLQNPEILDLQIHSFQKASRQLHKVSSEMQDTIMSIRMLPVDTVFQKMKRVVRDMNKKLGKDVYLEIIGEETEVDKSVIEHISDPLMHLVRNSIDHEIEDGDKREASGKPREGTLTLEAKNSGSDVLITVRDDGKGFDKEKILKKAKDQGLLTKSGNEMTEKEIYNMIFIPGFSTNDNVTEFSGRGVGMDVVIKNIETVGGTVSIQSVKGEGSAVTLKIPLTMAIIEGMNISVGKARYTIPTSSVKESFKPNKKDIIVDPSGREIIMINGICYPVLRIHKIYRVSTEITDLWEGVLIMIENDEKHFCIFADKVTGMQQVVVKTLPTIIKRSKRIRGLSGCTLLGDGCISLIINVGEFVDAAVTV